MKWFGCCCMLGRSARDPECYSGELVTSGEFRRPLWTASTRWQINYCYLECVAQSKEPCQNILHNYQRPYHSCYCQSKMLTHFISQVLCQYIVEG